MMTLVSGSLDCTVRLWDLRTCTCTSILTGTRVVVVVVVYINYFFLFFGCFWVRSIKFIHFFFLILTKTDVYPIGNVTVTLDGLRIISRSMNPKNGK